jgi:hemolysin III
MILIGATVLCGVFLLVKKYRYNHAVWHFVLVAACHYVAILLAVVSID